DPFVRARVASVNENTQLDPLSPQRGPSNDVWYVRLLDTQGKVRKTQMSKSQLLKGIRQGTLSSSVLASPGEKGPYRNLQAFPTFRDALRESRTRLKQQRDGDDDAEVPHAAYLPWWLWAAGLLAILWLIAWLIYWSLK